MSPVVKEFDEILCRIRVQGSLLLSAGLASDEYEDWNAVIASSRMIQNDAERGFDLLEKIQALAEAPLNASNDQGDQGGR